MYQSEYFSATRAHLIADLQPSFAQCLDSVLSPLLPNDPAGFSTVSVKVEPSLPSLPQGPTCFMFANILQMQQGDTFSESTQQMLVLGLSV